MDSVAPSNPLEFSPGSAEIRESSFLVVEGDEEETDRVPDMEETRDAWERLAREAPASVVTLPAMPVLAFPITPTPPPAPAATPAVPRAFPMAPEVPTAAFPPNLTVPLPRPGAAPTPAVATDSLEKLSAALQRVEAMVRDLHEERPNGPEAFPAMPHPILEGVGEIVGALRSLTTMATQPLPAPKKKWFGKPDFSAARRQWEEHRELLQRVLQRAEMLLREASVGTGEWEDLSALAAKTRNP